MANVDSAQLKELNGGVDLSQTFTPELGKRVPGNAYLYVELQNLGKILDNALKQQSSSSTGGMVDQQLKQFEAATGISFQNDLVPLLSGEHALYVGPGLPVSAGLLLKPADAAKGAETMKKLTDAIAKLAPGAKFEPLRSRRGGPAPPRSRARRCCGGATAT